MGSAPELTPLSAQDKSILGSLPAVPGGTKLPGPALVPAAYAQDERLARPPPSATPSAMDINGRYVPGRGKGSCTGWAGGWALHRWFWGQLLQCPPRSPTFGLGSVSSKILGIEPRGLAPHL